MARGFETTTGLVIKQGIFEESSSANHNIGTRMQLADGRVFYYALAGEGLAQGKICQGPATKSGHEDCDVATATSAGDKAITVTPATTTVIANEYAEGFVVTRETGNTGQTVKIKSHPAAVSAANVTLTLYDPLVKAMVTTAQVDLVHNPFYKIIQDAGEEATPAGVPLIAVTDAYYAWVQTWGICGVLCDGAPAEGAPVTLGTVAGSVAPLSTETNSLQGGTYPIVGVGAEHAGVDTKYSAILLQIWP